MTGSILHVVAIGAPQKTYIHAVGTRSPKLFAHALVSEILKLTPTRCVIQSIPDEKAIPFQILKTSEYIECLC